MTAARGIKTALVEGDLQFGDMGFWLGLDVKLSSLAQGTSCIPVPISARLDLFKAPVLPEVAEEISEAVARLANDIRDNYDIVIADTGQFWSGLTGELLCNSSLVLIVMDQRRASTYGAIKALELCQRLGIPMARIAFVLNRASGMSIARSSVSKTRSVARSCFASQMARQQSKHLSAWAASKNSSRKGRLPSPISNCC